MNVKALLKPSLDWLLLFVPIAIYFRLTTGLDANGVQHGSPTYVFIAACLAVVPLAGWMGRATEHLAEKTGEGIGGLLNATFGNAAELIIALMAPNKGLFGVVKASLTGSIIGNLMLVAALIFVADPVEVQPVRDETLTLASYELAAKRSESGGLGCRIPVFRVVLLLTELG